MSDRKGWDLTSKHSLEAACEWVREKSGAILVVAIRGEDHGCDVAFACDAQVSPRSAVEMLESMSGELHDALEAQRRIAREQAEAAARNRELAEAARAARAAQAKLRRVSRAVQWRRALLATNARNS